MGQRLQLRRMAAVLGVLAGLTVFGTPASAEKRIALVVGNNAYPNLPAGMQLRNAISDARAVRDTLKGLGFDVLYGENLDRSALVNRTFDLASRLSPGDTAFFFFAGHGVSFSGANYLLPTDVPVPRGSGRAEEGRLADLALAETQVIERITASGARVAIVVLDACRDNPLQSADRRSIGNTRGLAQGPPPRGVFSIYSAGFGQAALDRLGPDDRHPNSVFTRVFVDKLKTPGIDLKVVATETRRAVAMLAEKAGYEQFPAYYDQIIGGDVYLAGLPQPAVPVAVAPAPQPDKRARELAAQEREREERAKELRAKEQARLQEERRRAEEASKARDEAARQASAEEAKRRAAAEEAKRRAAVEEAKRSETAKIAAIAPATSPGDTSRAPVTARSLSGRTDDVRLMAFSPDGRFIVTDGANQTVRLWDAESGRLVHAAPKLKSTPSSVAVSPDGRVWAAAAAEVQLWHSGSGKPLRTLPAATSKTILFMADGKHVLSNVIFGLAVFDIATGKAVRKLDLGYHVEWAALSPDERSILALTRNPATGLTEPRLLSLDGGAVVRSYPDHKWTAAMALSADGRRVATGGDDKRVRVLDIDGRERWSVSEEGSVRSVAFSPDGKLVAIGLLTGPAALRNAETGELLRRFDERASVYALAFSPDGRTLALSFQGKTVQLVDMTSSAPATARQ